MQKLKAAAFMGVAVLVAASCSPAYQQAMPTSDLSGLPAKSILYARVTTAKQLPPCNSSTVGGIAAVTDANKNGWGAAVMGGGAVQALVYCDGTAWRVH